MAGLFVILSEVFMERIISDTARPDKASDTYLQSISDIHARLTRINEISISQIRKEAVRGLRIEELLLMAEVFEVTKPYNFARVITDKEKAGNDSIEAIRTRDKFRSEYIVKRREIFSSSTIAVEKSPLSIEESSLAASALLSELDSRMDSLDKSTQDALDRRRETSSIMRNLRFNWPSLPYPSLLKPEEIAGIKDMMGRQVGEKTDLAVDIIPALSTDYLSAVAVNCEADRLAEDGFAYAISKLLVTQVEEIVTFEDVLRYLLIIDERTGASIKSECNLFGTAFLAPVDLYSKIKNLLNESDLRLQTGWRTEVMFNQDGSSLGIGVETRRTRIYSVHREGERLPNNYSPIASQNGRIEDEWD